MHGNSNARADATRGQRHRAIAGHMTAFDGVCRVCWWPVREDAEVRSRVPTPHRRKKRDDRFPCTDDLTACVALATRFILGLFSVCSVRHVSHVAAEQG